MAATVTSFDIEVTDPGPARPSTGETSGHGYWFSTRRVRLVGGVLESGSNGAGFRVHAVLPTGADR